MIDELSSRDMTLSDLAILVVGGGYNAKAAPAYRPILDIIVRQARASENGSESGSESGSGSEIKLSSVCANNFALSTLTRGAAVALLKKAGIPLPRELEAPRTPEEANARIAELTAALQRAEAQRSPASAGAEASKQAGANSKIERTTMLILAAAVRELSQSKGPRYQGLKGRPNVSAIAADIGKHLKGAHGASSATIRARITSAWDHYCEEGGDTQLPSAS